METANQTFLRLVTNEILTKRAVVHVKVQQTISSGGIDYGGKRCFPYWLTLPIPVHYVFSAFDANIILARLWLSPSITMRKKQKPAL